MKASENTNINEQQLIQLLQMGNDSGYAVLYDRYAAMLFGVIKRVVSEQADAENILQDCFVKIWRNVGSYDDTKGKLTTWMLNIARNAAIDFTRSKAYSQKQKNQSFDNLVNPVVEVSEATQVPTDTLDIHRLVTTLTPACRQIIEWMYFEGYTQQEIADEFDIPLGTVKTRARTALIELRKLFV
jgi:RNA polymerase sigma-70 factor, ECF subfamily